MVEGRGVFSVGEKQKVLETVKARGDLICVLSSGFASVIRIALQHVGLADLLPPDLIYGYVFSGPDADHSTPFVV